MDRNQQHLPKENQNHDVENVLTKIVRLVANVSINPTLGPLEASNSAIIEPLIGLFSEKSILENEELVLNTVAAITNLLFYDSPSNILYFNTSKKDLCETFQELLIECQNMECLIEAARALGNLSRDQKTRKLMCELRIHQAVVILFEHGNRSLDYFLCGVLVNLASDGECALLLCEEFFLFKNVNFFNQNKNCLVLLFIFFQISKKRCDVISELLKMLEANVVEAKDDCDVELVFCTFCFLNFQKVQTTFERCFYILKTFFQF